MAKDAVSIDELGDEGDIHLEVVAYQAQQPIHRLVDQGLAGLARCYEQPGQALFEVGVGTHRGRFHLVVSLARAGCRGVMA